MEWNIPKNTMNAIYEERFFLRPGESNAQAEMPLTLLAARIIEVATNHANSLHIGYSDIKLKNMGWVLVRLTIEMNRYPQVNEHYKLKTWIQNFNHMFSERNFEFSDDDGIIIGYARTTWMMIDTQTHSNVGLQNISLQSELIAGYDCPINKQTKHLTINDDNPQKYKFKYSDIDFYRHVNTIRYIELLSNCFSMEKYDEYHLARFEITFIRECIYGMEVNIFHDVKENTDCMEINHNGKKLCTSRFIFKKRQNNISTI